ncbi:MAG: Fur family transcriptional regulator [Phycisphaerales bacterium]
MDAATIREVFERHSLRWTKQREEVYAALHASEAHPTADELYHLVNGRARCDGVRAESEEVFTPISLATVYNCLEAFMKCGLCRRLASPATTPRGDGAFRYDADMADHAHIVGADGRVIDLPDELSRKVLACVPPSVVREVEQRLGVGIGRISVELFETGRANPHAQ